MLNFIDETNKVFWIIVDKKEMNKRGGLLEEAIAGFDCDKKIIVINNKEYQNTNGYRGIAKKMHVDYSKNNLVFVELEI